MNLVIKATALLFLFKGTSTISGIDPETILPNYRSQQYKILIDKTKPWIQSHELKSSTQACAMNCRPNHDIKQHAKNNSYFIDPNYTFNIIPKRGDSTRRPRINRAIIEKTDGKLYQDQMNAEEMYDLKHRENIEANFQSLAYKTDNQMTNIHDDADAKAKIEAVFGFYNSELEQNNTNNRLNTANKDFIGNSTLMARIADIFGPPPTDFNNLHFKRNIDEKNYQGSLQAAIYKSFGPEILKTSDNISDGVSITSLMEDDGDTADNSGLGNRFPPYDVMIKISAEHHKTSTTTQNTRTAESTPNSRHISRNRPDLGYPDSSTSGNWASSSPKTQEEPTPTRSSLISSSSPSLLSPSILPNDNVDDLPSSISSTSSVPTAPSRNGASSPIPTPTTSSLISSTSPSLLLPSILSNDDGDDSTSSVPTAPSGNGARASKANSVLLSSFLYCFCLMAASL